MSCQVLSQQQTMPSSSGCFAKWMERGWIKNSWSFADFLRSFKISFLLGMSQSHKQFISVNAVGVPNLPALPPLAPLFLDWSPSLSEAPSHLLPPRKNPCNLAEPASPWKNTPGRLRSVFASIVEDPGTSTISQLFRHELWGSSTLWESFVCTAKC